MRNQSLSKINLLRENARSVVRELGLLNDAFFEIGVSLAERHLLIELSSSKKPLTAQDIAQRLLLDKSTISRLVARAVKKGYITFSTDQKDKRKRLLQSTDLGKSTLAAFESIAFNQTKDALETLNREESNLVHQGVALYARGLQNSRQKNIPSVSIENKADIIESLEEVQNQLQKFGCKLELFKPEDEKALFAIYKEIVEIGCKVHFASNTIEAFRALFFCPESHVYVCRTLQQEVIGGFLLKPNYVGRADHISNATYIIKSTHRGMGIGTLLVKASLHIARNLGFLSMQFNMVLSQNTKAIDLYEKLGFEIIGTVPNAVRNQDGSFQDGHIMYRKIDNC